MRDSISYRQNQGCNVHMEQWQSVTKPDEKVWLAWVAKNARRDRERARRRWRLSGAAMIFIAIAALIVLMRS